METIEVVGSEIEPGDITNNLIVVEIRNHEDRVKLKGIRVIPRGPEFRMGSSVPKESLVTVQRPTFKYRPPAMR